MHSHRISSRANCALTVLGAAVALWSNSAHAAGLFFDVNGATAGSGVANGGSYNWDDPNWSTSSAGTAVTTNYVQGSFAEFSGGASTNTYTITVGSDEQAAGLDQLTAGVNIIFNASGSGAIDMASGLQGIIGSGGAAMTFNAPITGPGAIEPELNGGNLNLFASNSYSGGTTLAFSSNLVNFNNNNAFGTGDITNNESATAFAPLLSQGGHTITIPNNFVQGTNSGAGVNFGSAANTPVVSTGNWSMGTKNLNLRNNGDNTATLTLSGVISGSANLILSGANGGAIIFSGSNTYTGTTTVGISTAKAITLKLGAANTIATSTSLVLAGGKLDPGGFTHTMTGTTLGMTAASIIDFSAGASEMDFAKSSGLTWTGILNLTNWTPGTDALRFGTDNTGLTPTQLADIEFNGSGLGTAGLDPSGFLIAVPEPMIGLFALSAPLLLSRRRRR